MEKKITSIIIYLPDQDQVEFKAGTNGVKDITARLAGHGMEICISFIDNTEAIYVGVFSCIMNATVGKKV